MARRRLHHDMPADPGLHPRPWPLQASHFRADVVRLNVEVNDSLLLCHALQQQERPALFRARQEGRRRNRMGMRLTPPRKLERVRS